MLEDLQLKLKEYDKLDAALLGAAGDDRLQLLHLVYKQCFEQPWVKEIRFGTSRDVAPVLSSLSSPFSPPGPLYLRGFLRSFCNSFRDHTREYELRSTLECPFRPVCCMRLTDRYFIS